jgi:hypothetical protein
MRPDQQFTCISLVATRLLALEQNGSRGAPLLRSCFRGLAIIRFSNSEEIAGSLTNLHGQLSVLRPTSLHCLAGSFSTLFGRKLTRTGLSAPTAEFHSSRVLWCH